MGAACCPIAGGGAGAAVRGVVVDVATGAVAGDGRTLGVVCVHAAPSTATTMAV